MGFRIVKKREQLSGEEIASYQDFDQLLKRASALKIHQRRKRTFLVWGSVLLVGVMTTWYFTSKETFEPGNEERQPLEVLATPEIVVKDPVIEEEKTSPAIENPSIKEEEPEKDEPVTLPLVKAKGEVKPTQVDPVVTEKESEVEEKVTPPQRPEVEQKDIFIKAKPRGGFETFYKYLNDSLKYPISETGDNKEGYVKVRFVVDKKGKAKEPVIAKPLGKRYDDEALRVILNMPSWNPATFNGEPVESKLLIDLSFVFKKEEQK